jgi:hypothetical protein
MRTLGSKKNKTSIVSKEAQRLQLLSSIFFFALIKTSKETNIK